MVVLCVWLCMCGYHGNSSPPSLCRRVHEPVRRLQHLLVLQPSQSEQPTLPTMHLNIFNPLKTCCCGVSCAADSQPPSLRAESLQKH